MGKEIADGREALASIVLAVLVCLFTGSFQRSRASAELRLSSAAAPWRSVRVGIPPPPASSRGLARPVQLPALCLSARGRTITADRHPGCWP